MTSPPTLTTPSPPTRSGVSSDPAKRKLTYKEQRELESLEAEIETLTAEKAALETQLSSGTLAYEALQSTSARIGQIITLLDEKELRWLELSDLAS